MLAVRIAAITLAGDSAITIAPFRPSKIPDFAHLRFPELRARNHQNSNGHV